MIQPNQKIYSFSILFFCNVKEIKAVRASEGSTTPKCLGILGNSFTEKTKRNFPFEKDKKQNKFPLQWGTPLRNRDIFHIHFFNRAGIGFSNLVRISRRCIRCWLVTAWVKWNKENRCVDVRSKQLGVFSFFKPTHIDAFEKKNKLLKKKVLDKCRLITIIIRTRWEMGIKEGPFTVCRHTTPGTTFA